MFFSRGKNKVQNPSKVKDLYNYYISTVEKDSPFDIPYSLYKSIVIDYTQAITDAMFEGYEFILPGRLGSMFIRKRKTDYRDPKYLSVNWEMYNKHKKIIYHLNEHSDGFRYKFHWDKREIPSNNASLYKVAMTRAHKRRLAQVIKNHEKDFIEY